MILYRVYFIVYQYFVFIVYSLMWNVFIFQRIDIQKRRLSEPCPGRTRIDLLSGPATVQQQWGQGASGPCEWSWRWWIFMGIFGVHAPWCTDMHWYAPQFSDKAVQKMDRHGSIGINHSSVPVGSSGFTTVDCPHRLGSLGAVPSQHYLSIVLTPVSMDWLREKYEQHAAKTCTLHHVSMKKRCALWIFPLNNSGTLSWCQWGVPPSIGCGSRCKVAKWDGHQLLATSGLRLCS